MNSVRQAGLFWDQIHDGAEVLQNLSSFNIDLVCVKVESFEDIDTTKWIEQHISTLASFFSNLVNDSTCSPSTLILINTSRY